jgi:hypothetical protein
LTAAIELFNCVFNYTENTPQPIMNNLPTIQHIPYVHNWVSNKTTDDKNINDSFELIH